MAGFTVLNTLLGLLVFSLLLWLTWRFALSSRKEALFGLAWFALLTLPGLMYRHMDGSNAYDYLEHRSYLPMVGIIIWISNIYKDVPEGGLKLGITGSVLAYATISGFFSFIYAKNYKNPLTFYERAVVSNPVSAATFYNRGIAREVAGDYPGALEDYEKAQALNPHASNHQAEIFVNKGIVLATLHDHAGAIAQYDSAIKYQPGLFPAHFNKANSKYDQGLYDDALKEYTRSIAINPAFIPVYIARGNTYVKLNDLSSASKDFSTAISMDSLNMEACFRRGCVRFIQKDTAGACSDWMKAAGSGSTEAQDFLYRYCR